MLKVIIADDEEKVCRLIFKLVDWETLGMSVVAFARNGIEALKLVQEHHPDIVITDIRMPGYDGLELIRKAKELHHTVEFIIISGYRQFEYAQSAIKFGVNDYLLKPIKKEELNHTLSKMAEEFRKREEQLSNEEEMKILLKRGINQLRQSAFPELMEGGHQGVRHTLETFNQKYQFETQEGYFQICAIKIDSNGTLNQNSADFIGDKIRMLVSSQLRPVCYDLEMDASSGIIWLFLNFAQEQQKSVRKNMKALLDELIQQESLFEKIRFSIGLGEAVLDLNQLPQSFHSAQYAVEQRLITGTGKLLEGEHRKMDGRKEWTPDLDLEKKFRAALGRMDAAEAEAVIMSQRERLRGVEGITGHEILCAVKQMYQVFCSYLKEELTGEGEAYAKQEQFEREISDYSSMTKLFSYTASVISNALAAISENEKQKDLKPVRTAKQYIENNYMKSLTLEEVSRVVGFNPTYFSTVFKKETGLTFLEYLSNIRMSQAKQCLKGTNLTVAAICEQVGYSDVRHFTKSFTKYTGLKPNEYRKIYS